MKRVSLYESARTESTVPSVYVRVFRECARRDLHTVTDVDFNCTKICKLYHTLNCLKMQLIVVKSVKQAMWADPPLTLGHCSGISVYLRYVMRYNFYFCVLF